MWNGAPGSSTPSASSSAAANGSRSVNAPSLVACMCAKSITGRTQPGARAIASTSSSEPKSRTRPITSMPNGTARSFLLEPLAQLAELLDDRVDGLLARPAEQEAGVEHDELGAAAVAIPASGRAAPSAMFHFLPRSRCPMKPKSGACTESATSCSRASSPSARPTGSPSRSPTRSRSRRRCTPARAGARRRLGALPRGSAPGQSDASHPATVTGRRLSRRSSVRRDSYPRRHGSANPYRPARARHRPPSDRAVARGRGIGEWSLEVVAAFMRAAYGKGYCDALTEDAPGSLCARARLSRPRRAPRARRSAALTA